MCDKKQSVDNLAVKFLKSFPSNANFTLLDLSLDFPLAVSFWWSQKKALDRDKFSLHH